MFFHSKMKVKWKQMLLWVLLEGKNSEMESLTLHQSWKQSKERWRDSGLYLKLSGYTSLTVWKLQLQTLSGTKLPQICAGTKEYVQTGCSQSFLLALLPLHEIFKCLLGPRVKPKGPFCLWVMVSFPLWFPVCLLVFFFPWFTGYVYRLVGQRRAWPWICSTVL